MKAVILDGTPKEIGEALKAMSIKTDNISISESSGEDLEKENIDMPKVFAKRVLSRIGLKQSQKTLLKAIYDSSESGILGSELLAVLGYNQAQFRGMMGAFGRRIANTDGYSSDFSDFFTWEWDDVANSYRYWLTSNVREAVKECLKL